VADPIWWKEQNEVSIYCLVLFSPSSKISWHNSYVIYFQAMPSCISFRDAPLEHEEQMRIVFHAISDKNETSFVPIISGVGGDGNIEGQREEQPSITPNDRPTSAKRPATTSPMGKKKKTFRDQCMKYLVDAYEKKAS
jgi:hypothetical protein